jgi:hypothetical protein
MGQIDGNYLHILGGILSNYRVVFTIVCVLFIGLVLEISLISVSGFGSTPDVYTNVKIFTGLEIFCLISQFIVLNFVHKKVSYFISHSNRRIYILHKAILLTQLGIIALLAAILYEITFNFSYHLILLEVVFLISFSTAICVMALLSSRFIIWLRSNLNRISVAYLLASSCLCLSSFIGVVYLLDELANHSEIVHPIIFGGFVMHGGSAFADPFTISSSVAFVTLWLGSVFLLHSYRKRLGTIKYWIIMSVPLLYFLSQFEPTIINVLFNSSLENPTLFSILYVILVIASKPVGGILFGLAFLQVARKMQHPEVKSYMIISAIGLLLLVVSLQAQTLVTAPFPPFGLLSVSFMGLSSYLIFVGIYSSAVSVSQDSSLRASIRNSVEEEVNFVSDIGSAQMHDTVIKKVLDATRRISSDMPEETGITSSLTDNEITEYIEQVLREKMKDSK